MPQNDIKQTFKSNQFRHENIVPNELMTVEYRGSNPTDLADNPKRIWARTDTAELFYTVDGVNVESVATAAQLDEKATRVKTDAAAIITYKNAVHDEKSLSVIGDSISQGANAYDITNNSWTGILRKFTQNEYESDSHGFVNAYDKTGSGALLAQDFHLITSKVGFDFIADGEYIGAHRLESNVAGSTITYQINKLMKNVRVYYAQQSSGGDIKVTVNGVDKLTFSANGVEGKFKRTAAIDISAELLPINITITHVNGAKAILTGMGYYDNVDDVMFNNFGRSGLRLVQVSDDAMNKMCETKLSFFALGHNDDGVSASITDFNSKLAVATAAYNSKNAVVIVLDFIWKTSANQYKQALQNFANGLNNGFYVNCVTDVFNATSSSDMLTKGYLSDSSHPTPLGHKLIAEYIAKILGFTVASKAVAAKLETEETTIDNEDWVLVPSASLQNGWVNSIDTSNNRFKYCVRNQVVYYQGLVQAGTFGTNLFLLPVGYRPQQTTYIVNYMKPDMLQFYGSYITTAGNIVVTGKDYNTSGALYLTGSFPLYP